MTFFSCCRAAASRSVGCRYVLMTQKRLMPASSMSLRLLTHEIMTHLGMAAGGLSMPHTLVSVSCTSRDRPSALSSSTLMHALRPASLAPVTNLPPASARRSGGNSSVVHTLPCMKRPYSCMTPAVGLSATVHSVTACTVLMTTPLPVPGMPYMTRCGFGPVV